MRIEFQKIGSQKLESNFCTNNINKQDIDYNNNNQCLDSIKFYPINYNNLSFTAKSDARILLEHAEDLVCAYSGKKMLSPYTIREIYSKLRKKQNAQASIVFLQNYENYMHKAEKEVFDILKSALDKSHKDFSDILNQKVIDSRKRLKIKQIEILKSTDELIDNLSDDIKNNIISIKENAFSRIEDWGFSRKYTLRELRKVEAKGNDKKIINEIFKAWHKLPNSKTDADAFIIKYFSKDHYTIAKMLLSSSVATIEHIKPASKGGNNMLGNYLLVSSKYNSLRDSMPLNMFIETYPELKIEDNIQKYMNLLIRGINTKKIDLIRYDNYPQMIKENISKSTKGKIDINVNKINNDTFPKTPKQKTVKRHKSFNRFK